MSFKLKLMKYFNNSTERLSYLIEKSGKSQRAFALQAGIDPSNMTKIRNGVIGVTSSLAKKIERAFGYSALWLLKGEGDVELSKEERTPVGALIPYFDELPVSGGQYGLAAIPSDEVPSRYVTFPGLDEGSFAFPVVGCSMEPVIRAGEVIVVNEVNSWDRVDPDKVYMVITRDDRMIKHLSVDNDDPDVLWCISENEHYSKFRIRKSEIVKVYRVTFHGSLL